MKKILSLVGLLSIAFLVSNHVSGQAFNRLVVQEQDGSPSLSGVSTIEVSNGSLTNVGSGVVQVTTGPTSGSGTQVEIKNAGSAEAAIDIQDSSSVTWDLTGGVLTATSSGGGGGAGESKNGGSYGQAAASSSSNSDLTATSLNTSTYTLVNAATANLTENYDMGANLSATTGKIEVCYSGSASTGALVQLIGSYDTTVGGQSVLLDLGVGATPVANSDATGTSTDVFGTFTGGFSRVPFYLEREITLTQNQCVGLLAKVSTTAEPTFQLADLTFLIWLDDAFTQAAGTGYADIGSVFAVAGDGRYFPIGVAREGKGVYFPAGTASHSGASSGPGLVSYIFGVHEQEVGHGPLAGIHLATVEVNAKTSTGEALSLYDRGRAGQNNLIRINKDGPSSGSLPQAMLHIGTNNTGAFLEALGYVGEDYSPVMGLQSDYNQDLAAGKFVVSSEPSTAGNGGGYCLASSTTGYANLGNMIDDSICISIDPSETTTFSQGHPFLDENRDGVKNGDDVYLGASAIPAVPSHLTYFIEGPAADSTIKDIDRVRVGFTAGNLYCKTDQGTIAVNIQIDDGVSAGNMLSTSLTCTSSHAGASTSTFGGSSGAALGAGEWVDIVFGATTGSPGQVVVILDE